MNDDDDSRPAGSGGADWDRWTAELTDDAGSDIDGDSEAAVAGGSSGSRVDSVRAQGRGRLVWAAAIRRPIVPAWLRTRAELANTLRWLVGFVGHTAAYHLIRIPKYLGKLTLRSPVGVLRAVRRLKTWWFDLEGTPVRSAIVRKEDAATYLQLCRLRDRRVRWRGFVTVASTIGLLIAAIVLLVWGTTSLQALTLVGLVIGLGVVGGPQDKPLLDTAVVIPRVQKLTSDVVVRALSVLSLSGINQALAKNPKAISFVAPITRDGPGWRADIDLPYGVTVGEVMDRRDKLAAGLARPLGCVWPEGQPDIHPGRLVLWVGDQDMATSKQPAWPLARSGTVDLFKPFPFGTDPRGRQVDVELMYSNMLIGAMPGAGKTFSLKVPLLAAALDSRAELWVFELKGSGDLDCFQKISARYASGADDPELEQALQALRDLRQECSRRAKVIAGLPKDVCPENKVTAELASRKSLKLHPLVVAVDECQELFSHKEFGDEAGELAEKCIKLGRALGVIVLLATQRPDRDSLPTGISANVGTRFCLRVMGQTENDMILGTSSYKNGLRATTFTRRDKGVGYLVGGDDPQIVRSSYIDAPAAERITERARAMRETAGTLTGHATGSSEPEPARHDLLADILAVVPETEPKIWNETVVGRLADLRPDTYGPWLQSPKPAEQLTAALKPYRVKTNQVWGTTSDGAGANRRGLNRKDITNAVTERNQKGDRYRPE